MFPNLAGQCQANVFWFPHTQSAYTFENSSKKFNLILCLLGNQLTHLPIEFMLCVSSTLEKGMLPNKSTNLKTRTSNKKLASMLGGRTPLNRLTVLLVKGPSKRNEKCNLQKECESAVLVQKELCLCVTWLEVNTNRGFLSATRPRLQGVCGSQPGKASRWHSSDCMAFNSEIKCTNVQSTVVLKQFEFWSLAHNSNTTPEMFSISTAQKDLHHSNSMFWKGQAWIKRGRLQLADVWLTLRRSSIRPLFSQSLPSSCRKQLLRPRSRTGKLALAKIRTWCLIWVRLPISWVKSLLDSVCASFCRRKSCLNWNRQF